ncbi:MAG: hypothetical protein AB4368_23815 [Xenococcaceae cyanobacterium]
MQSNQRLLRDYLPVLRIKRYKLLILTARLVSRLSTVYFLGFYFVSVEATYQYSGYLQLLNQQLLINPHCLVSIY